MIAVIGTGAVGAAVTRRLLSNGHPTTVWNRTPARIPAGVGSAGSIQEAVSASELVLLTLTDAAAVRQCLDALDGKLSGRTLVGMYTGTPGEARLIAAQVAEAGGRYLDAGVQAAPESFGTDAATILYSGSRAAFEEHRDVLALLGEPRFVGAAPEAAAVWDLALFGVWYDAQLGLLRALDTARAAGIDVAEFGRTAATQLGHAVAGVPDTVRELTSGVHPRGPADLTEHLKVVRHLIELRAGHRLGDGGLPDVAERLASLIAEGHGREGLTAAAG